MIGIFRGGFDLEVCFFFLLMMAGMLSMASRNISRRILRVAANTVERNSVESNVKHRQLHSGVRNAQKNIHKKFNISRTISQQWMVGLRQFHATPAVFEIVVVKVPPFADSVSEGDVRWEKKQGDQVAEDDVVLEIETDKTSVPVPAPGSGTIIECFVKNGDTVKAGQDLFKLDITGVKPSGGAAKPAAAPAPAAPKPAAAAPPPAAATAPPPSKPAAAAAPPPPPPPKAAAAPVSSIPVAAIRHAQSIEQAIVKMPPADPTKEITGTRTEHRVKMTRMRLKIAQRLKDAQNTTAMLTTFNEIDMGNIMEWRKANLEAFTKIHGFKIGFMSIFTKAAAYALQNQPVINAVIEGNEIIYRDYVDISVAVATPKGLVVPVLRNVEQMNYADIEREMNVLAEKARKGSLAVEDMDGGTFTISNGGVFGSLMGTPIINPPQSSILGMHGIFDRPVAVKGQVVIRPMMYVALTYDHRLIDGREAVMFLRKIKAAVEDPRIMLAGM